VKFKVKLHDIMSRGTNMAFRVDNTVISQRYAQALGVHSRVALRLSRFVPDLVRDREGVVLTDRFLTGTAYLGRILDLSTDIVRHQLDASGLAPVVANAGQIAEVGYEKLCIEAFRSAVEGDLDARLSDALAKGTSRPGDIRGLTKREKDPILNIAFEALQQFFSGTTVYFYNGRLDRLYWLFDEGMSGPSSYEGGATPTGEHRYALAHKRNLVLLHDRFGDWDCPEPELASLKMACFREGVEKRMRDAEACGEENVGENFIFRLPIDEKNSFLILANNHQDNKNHGFAPMFADVPGGEDVAMEIFLGRSVDGKWQPGIFQKITEAIANREHARLTNDAHSRLVLLGMAEKDIRSAFSTPEPWESPLQPVLATTARRVFPRLRSTNDDSCSFVAAFMDEQQAMHTVCDVNAGPGSDREQAILDFLRFGLTIPASEKEAYSVMRIVKGESPLLPPNFPLERFGGVGNLLGVVSQGRPHPFGAALLYPEHREFPNIDVDTLRVFSNSVATAAANHQIAQMNIQLLELNAQLEKLASEDSLTGLYIRRAFDPWVESEIARMARENHGKKIGVIMVDADHFKHVNDNYGHLAGDLALRHIAALLKEEAEAIGWRACRYGGEEMITAGLIEDDAQAHRLAEAIRRRIEISVLVDRGKTIPLTVSVGVVTTGASIQTSELFDSADQAMYKAKQAGRNRVEIGGVAALVLE
jgi:diguanylate cyclase (GGDEF)-like protein